MEWKIHGESIWSGYGVDMEEIFENEMEWSGFGGEVSNFFIAKTQFRPKNSHKQD